MSAGVREWNLFDLCRLCLEREKLLVSVFETDDLQAKISSCLQVEILRTDEVTHKICDDCLNKVDSFYEFWNRTSQSQKELEKWLTQTKEEEKNIQVLHDKSESQNDELKDHLKTEDESIMSIDEESIRDEDRAEEEEEEEQQEEEEEEEDYEGEYENEEDVSGEEEIRENGSDPIAEARPEPTTFVNVPIESEEPGPSGIEPLESDSLTVPEFDIVKEEPTSDFEGRNKTFLCKKCGYEFQWKGQLLVHGCFQTARKTFACSVCKKSCVSLRHSRVHSNVVTYKCRICKAFRRPRNFLCHHKARTSINVNRCNICSRVFYTKSKLESHKWMHSKDYTTANTTIRVSMEKEISKAM